MLFVARFSFCLLVGFVVYTAYFILSTLISTLFAGTFLLYSTVPRFNGLLGIGLLYSKVIVVGPAELSFLARFCRLLRHSTTRTNRFQRTAVADWAARKGFCKLLKNRTENVRAEAGKPKSEPSFGSKCCQQQQQQHPATNAPCRMRKCCLLCIYCCFYTL